MKSSAKSVDYEQQGTTQVDANVKNMLTLGSYQKAPLISICTWGKMSKSGTVIPTSTDFRLLVAMVLTILQGSSVHVIYLSSEKRSTQNGYGREYFLFFLAKMSRLLKKKTSPLQHCTGGVTFDRKYLRLIFLFRHGTKKKYFREPLV